MSRPEIYVANAVAMWASIHPVTEPVEGVTRVQTHRSARLILRRPMPAAGLLGAEPAGTRVLVEDSFGASDPPAAVEVKQMPVMVRPAGPTSVVVRPGVEVRRVGTPEDLAIAEQVIVAGFPVEPPPVVPLLEPKVLTLPGWHVWLAYRDGAPAAAAYTYDDGMAAGVYLLATLPDHRSFGLGRAIMTTAVDFHAYRLCTLVATDAGAPLYRSLGFADVSTARWYIRSIVD